MNSKPPIAEMSRPVERFTVPGFAPPSPCAFMQQQTAHDYHDLLVNHGDNAAFALAMVSFLSRWQPDLLVVDVGLEASILARMCGIATIYTRQHGRRWDKGHQLAYEWAASLWAPFAADLEQADCPEWIKEKTFYSNGFSRFSGEKRADIAPLRYCDRKPNILVMTGFGGTDITLPKIALAAEATPDWQWHLLGDYSPIQASTVCCHGIVKNVWPYLCHADLVIANAGHNAVMEIAAAGTPSIFIPAERPFAEQQCKAETLDALGLSVVVPAWPEPCDWNKLWVQTRSLNRSGWKCLHDAEAPRRAANHIAQMAKQCMQPTQAAGG